MKKLLAILLALTMVLSLAACSGGGQEGPSDDGQPKTGRAAIDVIGEDGIDWNHLSTDELYEMAKAEGGTITIYSTTSDADTARKKIQRVYPDLNFEYISCDTNTVMKKIEMEAESGNPMADVLMVKDSSGEIYNELVLWDLVKVYYPADVCEHISDDLIAYGLPLYSTFNPWFYNTRMYDKVPIESWWDIVEGYNVDTQSYKDASGNSTQFWTIYSKDITAPSYAALWAQLIVDGDKLQAQYEKQYGEPLVFTYHEHLKNTPGVMELPENNAGVELFWRFSQMTITPLADGDAVVEAVNDSVNGPTLGLCSASKLDNSKQAQGENGMDIAWVTGLEPYTAQDAAAYSYVVSNCDNPAGARLYIRFLMGDADGVSGCYQTFDKLGHWSVRDDVTYEKSGITYEEVNLTAPDFAKIYANYPNVKAYWSLWNSTR
ncbi:MAG: extracellular solute-binding protein [Clostridia bacterium]|nr:extracellular solute-binding protein [Clostridia bacterium]